MAEREGAAQRKKQKLNRSGLPLDATGDGGAPMLTPDAKAGNWNVWTIIRTKRDAESLPAQLHVGSNPAGGCPLRLRAFASATRFRWHDASRVGEVKSWQ